MAPRRAITLDDLAPAARRQAVAQIGGHPDLGDAGKAAWLKMHPGAHVVSPADVVGRRTGGKFSAAVRNVGADGVPHDSLMERRVWERLKSEILPGETLLRKVRMPLLSVSPDALARPLFLTIDFAVLAPNSQDPPPHLGPWHLLHGCLGWVCWVEAKGKRRSRDWARGKAAFERAWGAIVETDR